MNLEGDADTAAPLTPTPSLGPLLWRMGTVAAIGLGTMLAIALVGTPTQCMVAGLIVVPVSLISWVWLARRVFNHQIHCNRLLQDALHQRDKALQESEERYRALVEWSPEAIAMYRQGQLIYVNPMVVQLFGAQSEADMFAKPIIEFVHPDSRPLVISRMKAAASGNLVLSMVEERYIKVDGSVIDLEVQSRSILFQGQPTIFVTMRDITSRKLAQREIENLAFFDTLTGLPNRRLLIDRLEQALAACTRHKRQGAVLFVDLDNFKDLNDSLGHDQGDQLLRQVGQRLSQCMREGDTVARFGGDEFVVILKDLSEAADEAASHAETVGEKVRELLVQPYHLDGLEYHSTPSIGITLFSDHEESVAEILRRADLAMYQAKAAGRNALRFFDPAMQAMVNERSALESDLRRALAEHQFSLHYQAQINEPHQLFGAEVLIRWQHPQRGNVPPNQFIPLAEETGLILALGNWVLETACRQLATWASHPTLAHLAISVNVSARQFHQDDFVEQVLSVIHKTGANPRRLKLELTESLLATNVEELITMMTQLKAQGIGFSLDDFGTGYSSLSYLKRLPLDQLKIDQSFVRDILLDPNDAAISRMVIVLAQSLGLQVIAEGVETDAQRAFLAEQGCHAYQGYLFGRPLPLAQFEAFASQS